MLLLSAVRPHYDHRHRTHIHTQNDLSVCKLNFHTKAKNAREWSKQSIRSFWGKRHEDEICVCAQNGLWSIGLKKCVYGILHIRDQRIEWEKIKKNVRNEIPEHNFALQLYTRSWCTVFVSVACGMHVVPRKWALLSLFRCIHVYMSFRCTLHTIVYVLVMENSRMHTKLKRYLTPQL